jgi:putative addiction module killer protein
MSILEVQQYQTANGRSPFGAWLDRLCDGQARARIAGRIDRMQVGPRGDWKAVGRGVFELRIDHGPGYRVYCGQDGSPLVLLLCDGDKRTQKRDIEVAHGYWQDYQTRTRKRAVSRWKAPPR